MTCSINYNYTKDHSGDTSSDNTGNGIVAPTIYMPRLSDSLPNNMNWTTYCGSWGTDLDTVGGDAPQGPAYISSGFPNGTRYLRPWDWEESFVKE